MLQVACLFLLWHQMIFSWHQLTSAVLIQYIIISPSSRKGEKCESKTMRLMMSGMGGAPLEVQVLLISPVILHKCRRRMALANHLQPPWKRRCMQMQCTMQLLCGEVTLQSSCGPTVAVAQLTLVCSVSALSCSTIHYTIHKHYTHRTHTIITNCTNCLLFCWTHCEKAHCKTHLSSVHKALFLYLLEGGSH